MGHSGRPGILAGKFKLQLRHHLPRVLYPQASEWSLNLTLHLLHKLYVFFFVGSSTWFCPLGTCEEFVGGDPQVDDSRGDNLGAMTSLSNRRFLMWVRPSMSISYNLLLRFAVMVASIDHFLILWSWTNTVSPGSNVSRILKA